MNASENKLYAYMQDFQNIMKSYLILSLLIQQKIDSLLL